MGQRFSRERQGSDAEHRATGPTMSSSNTNPINLFDELDRNLLRCPISDRQFLPLNVLDELITADNVLASVNAAARRKSNASQFSCNLKFAAGVVEKAKKLFAVLAFIGHEHAISDLLSEGLTDEDLPILRQPTMTRLSVESRDSGSTTHKAFQSWKPQDFRHFENDQWLFLAPVFDSTGKHLKLTGECAFPFLSPSQRIRDSVNSEVVQCSVHPHHYRPLVGVPLSFVPSGRLNTHPSLQTDQHQIQVAVKKIESRDAFEREIKNLNMIRALKSRHIIKHIVTCERNSSYYVVFPWASGGSLLDLWRPENDTARTPELVLWCLRQMLGLSDALRALHQDLEGGIHCRHGDLKPDNILLFEEGEDRFLVIADLGVSRIHEQPTELRQGGTTTKATTFSYQAPEASDEGNQDKPRHRTYDIWSLGCIFLEFVIWLLYDLKAVRNFGDHRQRRPQNPHRSFYQTTNEGQVEPDAAVLDAISSLREDYRCGDDTALGILVKLIAEKALVIPVEKRCNAEMLRNELQKIVQSAEQNFNSKNTSYLLKEPIHLALTPKIFGPAPRSLKSSRPDTPQGEKG